MKIKRMSVLVLGALLLLGLLAIDSVAAQPPEKVDVFVCPVLNLPDAAIMNSNSGFFGIADGDYSILPGKAGLHGSADDLFITVPVHATNNNGAGSPGGPHASPGDPEYTALWNFSI